LFTKILNSPVKLRSKVVPAFRGRRGMALLILNLRVDGSEWSVSHSEWFTLGTQPQYPLMWILTGSQRRTGRFGRKKYFLCQDSTPDCPARKLNHYTDYAIPAS